MISFGGVSPSDSTWQPIPALSRDDADTSIFFLSSNGIGYSAPVEDPWFSATTKANYSGLDGNGDLYETDYLVNVLACIDQHQFCVEKTCTPLTSLAAANNASDNLQMKTMQRAVMNLMATSTVSESIWWSVQGLRSNALRASDTILGFLQGPLPSDQWTIEVSAWMATSLARLQQLTVDYATGTPSDPNKSHIIPPSSKEEKSLCNSQVVRSSTGTTSFSVLGISIILIVGAILLALDVVLSTVVGFLRRVTKFRHYKRLQWILDEKLQLHRLAYEEAGQGHWTDCDGSVPITKEGDRIGIPEGIDTDHPRLSTRSHFTGNGTANPEAASLIGEKNSYTTSEAMRY